MACRCLSFEQQTEKQSVKPKAMQAKDINPQYSEIATAMDAAVPLLHPKGLYEAMRHAVRGSNLFGFMCLTACELVGGNSDVGMPVACAIEMLLANTLIQDDFPCLDNADMRRGKPATHKAFGEATAFLAATTLIGAAFEHIVKATPGTTVERKLRLVEELARTEVRVGWGQYMDMQEVEGEGEADLERIQYINMHKSSALFEACVVMGGIVGGGSEEQISLLRKFGCYLGHLINVIDDMSDATMSAEAMGKDGGIDIRNKKRNFFTLLGHAKCMEMAEDLSRKAKIQLASFPDNKHASMLKDLVDVHMASGVSVYNPNISHKS